MPDTWPAIQTPDHDRFFVSGFALIGLASSAFKRGRGRLEHRPTAFVGSALMIGVAAALAISPGNEASGSTARSLPTPSITPPDPPPFLLRKVDATTAASLNAKIPFSTEPNFAAKPFKLGGPEEARSRAVECLALAVYYEAASEGEAGGAAVAQVVVNRVRHPAFPGSICGVVFQGSERETGCQFTFTCDGSLMRTRSAPLWERSRKIAEAALNGTVYAPVGLATHYHADYVVPYWATSLAKNAQVGVHIFYRWPGGWGQPRSFTRRYAGLEVDPVTLESAALRRALSRFDANDLIEVGVDRRVELLGVVQLLAIEGVAPSDDDSQYEKDAKAYFQPEGEHRAVQLFKSLTAANRGFLRAATDIALSPKAVGEQGQNSADRASDDSTDADLKSFEEALDDFAQSSEFDRFFAGHKPFYGRLAAAGKVAAIANAQWQAYTGLPTETRKLIVSALLQAPAASGCGAAEDAGSQYTPIALLKTSTNADAFLATGQTGPSLAVPSSVRDQIVRAVFARVAALTNGEAAARKLVAHDVRSGYDLVPKFETRLRNFESHRVKFATLAAYLPELLSTGKQRTIEGGARADQKPRAAATCPNDIAATVSAEEAHT